MERPRNHDRRTDRNRLFRIRADVRAMHAYTVQAADGLLKMDAMENPFGLPPALQAALGQRLGALALNRYPGPRTEVLRDALARHAKMPEGCALLLGNGSDEPHQPGGPGLRATWAHRCWRRCRALSCTA